MDRGHPAASSVPILFYAFAERGRHISKKQKNVRPSARSSEPCLAWDDTNIYMCGTKHNRGQSAICPFPSRIVINTTLLQHCPIGKA